DRFLCAAAAEYRFDEHSHLLRGPGVQELTRDHAHRKDTGLWLYGVHSVRAALANPDRKVVRAVLTARAAEDIGKALLGRVRHEIADADTVSRLLPQGAVHQG